jgi:hypothetical protein
MYTGGSDTLAVQLLVGTVLAMSGVLLAIKSFVHKTFMEGEGACFDGRQQHFSSCNIYVTLLLLCDFASANVFSFTKLKRNSTIRRLQGGWGCVVLEEGPRHVMCVCVCMYVCQVLVPVTGGAERKGCAHVVY